MIIATMNVFDTLVAPVLIFLILYYLCNQKEFRSQKDVIVFLSLQILFAVIYYYTILNNKILHTILDGWARVWFRLRLPIRTLFLLLLLAASLTNFKVYFPLLCLIRAVHVLKGNSKINLESTQKRVDEESTGFSGGQSAVAILFRGCLFYFISK